MQQNKAWRRNKIAWDLWLPKWVVRSYLQVKYEQMNFLMAAQLRSIRPFSPIAHLAHPWPYQSIVCLAYDDSIVMTVYYHTYDKTTAQSWAPQKDESNPWSCCTSIADIAESTESNHSDVFWPTWDLGECRLGMVLRVSFSYLWSSKSARWAREVAELHSRSLYTWMEKTYKTGQALQAAQMRHSFLRKRQATHVSILSTSSHLLLFSKMQLSQVCEVGQEMKICAEYGW